jgi:hypothetical protein
MYIYFKRSGGFMGISVQTEVDTSSLPADQAEAIEHMLDEANFFDLPSDPSRVNEADRFTYELTVISDNTEHTVYFSEQDAPVEINTLVRQLTLLSRRHDIEDSDEES